MYDIYPHICRGEQNRQFHIRNTKWLHLTPKQEARTISSSDWVNEHRINMRFVYIHAEHGSIHREWNTFFMALAAQLPAVASCFLRFLGHTQQRTTVGRTPLDDWSARRRDLYLTTLTTDKHPWPRRDSNPQSQQASGRRPTQTARPLGPANETRAAGWNCHCISLQNNEVVSETRDTWSYQHEVRNDEENKWRRSIWVSR